MLLIFVELFLIILLVAVIFFLYKNEKAQAKNLMPRAKMEEYWNGRERRQHTRFEKGLEVTYTLITKPHAKDNCKTINISRSGAKLLLDRKLAMEDILKLEISIPDISSCAGKIASRPRGEKTITGLEGSVVWSKEADEKDASGKRLFHAGIKFLNIKEPSKISLTNYIGFLIQSAKD